MLLTGDFGWRKLLRRDDRTLVLLDFERAVIGPVWLELAKCLAARCLCHLLPALGGAGHPAVVRKPVDDPFAEHNRTLLRQVK